MAFLADVAGHALDELVRRIKPRIMVNHLSLLFNMGKHGFANPTICDVVFSEY